MSLFINTLRDLLLISSLSLALTSCQTTDQPSASEREASVLESQKALVRNSLDEGKPEMALKYLRELTTLYPEDASILNLMGLTQLALKNPTRAATFFLRAYKADKSVAAALNLSSAYLENGDYKRAITLLKAMTKQAEKEKYEFKERIYHNLGYAYLKLNQMTQATTWFKTALEENPTYFPASMELARIYEKTNRPAMAAETYRHAIDYCRSCFEPVQSLTMIYLKMGKIFEAKKLLVDFDRTDNIPANDRAASKRLRKLVDNSGPVVHATR